MVGSEGKPEVIDGLMECLRNSLKAGIQHRFFAKSAKDWGYHKFATALQSHSDEEVQTGDQLLARLVYLGCTPEVESVGPITSVGTLAEQLDFITTVERDSIERYLRVLQTAREAGDFGTVDLLTRILVEEESEEAWINEQRNLHTVLGDVNYRMLQAR